MNYVKIKNNIILGLDLPITLKFGIIKKLWISIQWRSLEINPVSLVMDNLFIIVSEKNV